MRPARDLDAGSGEALSIRFQADNDLKRIIVDATLRREPRIDFQTAQAARLDDLDDEAVLRLSAAQSRILVSHDKRTMPKALASFVASGGTSPARNRMAKSDRQSPVSILDFTADVMASGLPEVPALPKAFASTSHTVTGLHRPALESPLPANPDRPPPASRFSPVPDRSLD